MRPRLFTLRNALLLLIAVGVFGGMAYWLSVGAPLPGAGVPSTAGKIVFVSDRNGHSDLWMMDAKTGDNAVNLTSDEPEDRQPVFSSSGSDIAFVSEKRNGTVVPQIYTIDAKAGSKAIPLTNTSASKDQPRFGAGGRVFYLAAGKLSATDPANRETDQIFPEADEVRSLIGSSDSEENRGILSMGGIVSTSVSPDGKRIAAVIKTDVGQALLLIMPGEHAGQGTLLGVGRRILCEFLADGRLVASFADGSPLRQPQPLYNADMIKRSLTVPAKPINDLVLPVGNFPVAVFDAQGTVVSGVPLPFGPDAMVVSPDGTRVAIALAQSTGSDVKKSEYVGLTVLPLAESADQSALRLFEESVKSLTWSPDGTQIAFVSGKDIYNVPSDGNAQPLNLTKGKGANSDPTWSPAKAEKK